MIALPDTGFVTCDCCKVVIGEIRNGMLHIRAKHHGDIHITKIPLSTLTASTPQTKDPHVDAKVPVV
jgi:hypothetical protein